MTGTGQEWKDEEEDNGIQEIKTRRKSWTQEKQAQEKDSGGGELKRRKRTQEKEHSGKRFT